MSHCIENATEQSIFFLPCPYGAFTLEFCKSGYEFCISKSYSLKEYLIFPQKPVKASIKKDTLCAKEYTSIKQHECLQR